MYIVDDPFKPFIGKVEWIIGRLPFWNSAQKIYEKNDFALKLQRNTQNLAIQLLICLDISKVIKQQRMQFFFLQFQHLLKHNVVIWTDFKYFCILNRRPNNAADDLYCMLRPKGGQEGRGCISIVGSCHTTYFIFTSMGNNARNL